METKTETTSLIEKLFEKIEPQYRPLDASEEQKEIVRLRNEEIWRETRRIEWLNAYYKHTEKHGLPYAADLAKLELLDETGPDRESTELIRAWKPTDEFGFLLLGPAGCGKSFAMMALAKSIMFDHVEFSQKQQSLIWFSAVSGLDKIRREMSDNSDRYKRDVTKADFLFIDDLGSENLTEWSREQLYLILEHRISFCLPTFITTNCTIEELKSRYHERFVSRIKEACVVLNLKGRDRRSDHLKNNVQKLKHRIGGKAGA